MKPIRMQLECPYNSGIETKQNIFVLYSLQAMLFSEYQHMCGSTNERLVLYNSAGQHGVLFLELICFWTNQLSQWFNRPFRWTHFFFVSVESAVLDKSFDLNNSVNNLLKQGLAANYWQFYCLFLIHDSTKTAKVPAQKRIQQDIV